MHSGTERFCLSSHFAAALMSDHHHHHAAAAGHGHAQKQLLSDLDENKASSAMDALSRVIAAYGVETMR